MEISENWSSEHDKFWGAKTKDSENALAINVIDNKFRIGLTKSDENGSRHMILENKGAGSTLFAKIEFDSTVLEKPRSQYADSDMASIVSETLFSFFPMKIEGKEVRPFLIRLESRELGEEFDTQLGIKFTVEDINKFQEAFNSQQ